MNCLLRPLNDVLWGPCRSCLYKNAFSSCMMLTCLRHSWCFFSLEKSTSSPDTLSSFQRNIYIAPIIEFAIETGMRRSEILKLRWCDVDLENGFASLYDTKNGEDRRVPLTRRCIEVLQTVPRTHEQVFPVSATCLRLAWNRARNKAGITDLRFHDLRHEAASRFSKCECQFQRSHSYLDIRM